jgi:hypothetical protein
MEYEKPEVSLLASAAAIQGTKVSDPTVDSDLPPKPTNGAAYQADE